jgi:hypothetical protein
MRYFIVYDCQKPKYVDSQSLLTGPCIVANFIFAFAEQSQVHLPNRGCFMSYLLPVISFVTVVVMLRLLFITLSLHEVNKTEVY